MPVALLPLFLASSLAATTRLPADVVPRHYDLFFDVDPATGHYSGTVDIEVEVRAPVSELVLNAVDLELSEIAVTQGSQTLHPPGQPRPADEQVAFTAALAPGTAHFHARFAAALRKNLRGLYLAKTPTGEAWAATQFEPADARKAFPCFDEPAFKATFAVQVHAPTALSAVSNGPVTSDRVEGSGHRLQFAETPPISSYLVALAVGHFGVVEGQAGGVPIRVVTSAGQEQLGRFALQVAEKVIPWFERYTGIPYPFAKLDMVAIPEFEAGGMENAGAIFYRSVALLLDDAHASIDQQQGVERVVAHEIAHQWFGDLVTMRWWDDLWLNEAFASVMEYFCVRDLRPEWPRRQAFAADVAHAKGTDSLRATHAIHSAVASPAEADAQFDEITYIKGEGVLAMLANAVGDESFRAGLHRYLAANAFGNARAEDLFDAIGQAANLPVTDIAQSWTGQLGLPVVSVRRHGDTLTISQKRFTASPSKDDGTRWRIPFCVDSSTPAVPPGQSGGQKSAAECVPLLPSIRTVDVGHLEVPTAKQWVFANAEGAGFYRVDYDGPMLAALLPALRSASLTPEERISLLTDLWALAWSGGKLTPALDSIEALAADRDAEVVRQITRLFVGLDEIAGGKGRAPLAAWVRRRLGPILAELSWEPRPDEPPERSLLRAQVIGALDRAGHDPAVIAEARRRVDAALAGGPPLHATLRATLLLIAARHGDTALWDRLAAQLKVETVPELRLVDLVALMSFTAPELAQRSLALTVGDTISVQDIGLALSTLLSAPETRESAWGFLKAHFEALKPRLPPLLLNRRVFPSLAGFCDEKQRANVAAFFKDHPIAGAERPLDRALEGIEICTKVKPRLAAELNGWLAKHR